MDVIYSPIQILGVLSWNVRIAILPVGLDLVFSLYGNYVAGLSRLRDSDDGVR